MGAFQRRRLGGSVCGELAAPGPEEIRAYILEMVAGLAQLAKASGDEALAAKLQAVASRPLGDSQAAEPRS